MEYYKDLITVGIPAYNEEKHIRQAIESCVNQAGSVIISDNASEDGTSKICKELAKKFSNIIYIKHEKNQGEAWNFNFVLNQAKTKYFMWLGAHDYIDENYIKHAIHMLENSDSVAAYPSSRKIDMNGSEIGIFDCWYQDRISSDFPLKRVYTLICHLHEVSILFAVYKTEIAKKFPIKPIIGNDHVFICNMASAGKFVFSPRSTYNWRQTKINLNRQENISIWEKTLGNDKNKVSRSTREMQFYQLEALKNCSMRGYGILKKLILIFKAQKKLHKRFGD